MDDGRKDGAVIVQLWRVAGEADRLCGRFEGAPEAIPPSVLAHVDELRARIAELRALERRLAGREGVRHAG